MGLDSNIGIKDLIWGIDYIKVIENPVGSKLINILSSLISSCFTFNQLNPWLFVQVKLLMFIRIYHEQLNMLF